MPEGVEVTLLINVAITVAVEGEGVDTFLAGEEVVVLMVVVTTVELEERHRLL